ncbi:YacL family protein [Thalassomonas sp. M1454]|uniref:UPF0231 family protein n=1 Tax=Thalassomonas sp. M1454 TaxID=2594477 RepID=UPI0011802FD1|nr:YacL family protein [Thalassomonas sp. M1454]TRX54063.1 UPF0231 family protein [Thalassomonas sp. M1454]
MEYEFRRDFINGKSIANFTMEHETFAPWLEQEVADDLTKAHSILTTLQNFTANTQSTERVIGKEFSITMSYEDVEVIANSSLDPLVVPEQLEDDIDDFEQNTSAVCGREDFIIMLQSWCEFIQR